MFHFFPAHFSVNGNSENLKSVQKAFALPRDTMADDPTIAIVLRGVRWHTKGEDDRNLRRLTVRPTLMPPPAGTPPDTVWIDLFTEFTRDGKPHEWFASVDLAIVVDDGTALRVHDGVVALESDEDTDGALIEVVKLPFEHEDDKHVVTFLRGFSVGYTDSDHEVTELGVGVTDGPRSGEHLVGCSLQLRDSKDYDDPFGGMVAFSSLQFPKKWYGVTKGQGNIEDPTGSHDELGIWKEDSDWYTVDGEQTWVDENQDLFLGLQGTMLGFPDEKNRELASVRMSARFVDKKYHEATHRTSVRVTYSAGMEDEGANDAYAAYGWYAILSRLEGTPTMPRRFDMIHERIFDAIQNGPPTIPTTMQGS